MRLPRRLTTIAAAGCLALTAAGCGGGDPAPKPSMPTSKTAESKAATPPSQSSGPGEKTSESAAKSVDANVKKPVRSDYSHIDTNSREGAGAALRYFADGYRYGLLTGDPSVISDFSEPGCDPCRQMIETIESDGVRLSSAEWKFEGTGVDLTGERSAEGASKVFAKSVRAGRDSLVHETIYVGAQMHWDGSHWKAFNISVEVERS